jgi:heat shock protein HtpX
VALKTRLFLLIAMLCACLYGVCTGIGIQAGFGGDWFYIVLALACLGFQYLICTTAGKMRVNWITEKEFPDLYQMVAEQAAKAGLPAPKVGISQLKMPRAFAFGWTAGDGRICLTRGMLDLLDKDELRAVIGHELSHIKNRDMLTVTTLSCLPLIIFWIAWGLLPPDALIGLNESLDYAAVIGGIAFGLYLLTNQLVLCGARRCEYAADRASVRLGNSPDRLASALYKLACANALLDSSREEIKRLQVVKAFFLSDPMPSWQQVRQIPAINPGFNGTIDCHKLRTTRRKKIRLAPSDRMTELLGSHPNILKRIKRLAALNHNPDDTPKYLT